MKLVVCDDDATLRAVVSRLAERAGHTVIAETDSAADAVELVSRFGAEGLVLDLSLPWGSGTRALSDLRSLGTGCQIVLFTSHADLNPDVRETQVRAVVDKPDFDRLEQVLKEMAESPSLAAGIEIERRRAPRVRPLVPPAVVRTPSGLEDPDSFDRVVQVLGAGDAVLYVNVAAPDGAGLDPWSRLVHADRFLAVARTLRVVFRTQDRLSADGDQLAVLLLEGGRVGVESAWRRLGRAYELVRHDGVLSGGWALCEQGDPGFAIVDRARDAVQRSVGQPPEDRLWAG